MQTNSVFYRFLALLLCFLLSPLSGFCYQAAGTATQPAGSVTALDPAATRNGGAVNNRDQVQWNDLLQTNPSGRLRVGLRDGSILSLGSNSQMRVVQHDPVAQQTTLEILFGKLRSQVVKLTQPNSKFEVRSPTAVAGVIGTDFLMIVTADRTTVVVFSGIVQVTPLNGAGGTPNQSQSTNVNANQQVDVTANGVGPVQAITQQLIQQLMSQTTISHAGLASASGAGVQAASHTLRAILIGLGAVGAGAGVGIAIANSRNTSTPASPPPANGPGIPPR
ncbi:MAG TPA: FecR family protein [Terriglobales bacterium]|nr:FecR family protein [Terriglobales bacterium]